MSDVDTLTLAEFLLARIAEDEARVESLAGEWPDEIAVVPHSRTVDGCVAVSRPGPKSYVRVWSTHVRPDFGWLYHESGVIVWSNETAARVLAECEAKRKIVELHKTVEATGSTDPCCAVCNAWGEYPDVFPCETLRLLAGPYADHPNFRDGWRAELAR